MGIFTAVREGNEQEVIRRLDADPTLVETADADGSTVLAVAAQQNQLGMVKLLVQRGANINATGVFEMTPLDLAAQEGHEEIVAFLLDEGARPNSKYSDDRTSLNSASGLGHLGVVRVLVQHLEVHELDEGDNEGCTALHCAADEGHCEVVAFLLSKGAQASTRNTLNETPLISASGCGHIEVLRLLLQHMGPQALKDIDEDGWTALLNAAYWGQDEVLRFLLLAGSDHTITDKEGATARALAEGECIQEEEFHDEEEDDDEEHKEGKVRCVAVLEWWEGELERRAVLHRATCLHKADTMRRDMPTSRVPTYLKARVAAGHAVPVVEVVSPQSQEQQQEGEEEAGDSGKAREGDDAQGGQAGEKEEEERHAMLEFVVKALNEALVTELLEGFH